ncbi:MAG: efflux RND transporter permease subunit [Thermodesulfobacteriota bacterium]
MRGIVAWFAGNHVAANLLMIFLLAAGIFTGLTMKLEVFPEYTLDRISITVEYPGASPAEVEEAMVQQIEESVAGLAGIKRIDSTAREGSGTIIIEVMKGWNLQTLLDEVKAEVDRIRTFPEEAEKPVVREMTRRTQVISAALYGDVAESTLKRLAEDFKDDITNLPGITYAELFGIREAEIHIEISEDTLKRYGLTLGQVAQAVRETSLDLPAGTVKTPGGDILIRAKGRRYYAGDYYDVPVITRPDGAKVTLGQIAELKEGFQELDISARFQGKPAAVIQVFRVADQNALEVASTVKAFVEKVRPELPKGVQIDTYQDMSVMLKSRIQLLLKNMVFGLILVSILLGIFLDLRLAFWVTLGIPISFLSGLWILPQFDVSINMISLFAFIMVLGIVVDDAIVVGENIFRKQEEGLHPLKGSVEGALEVGRPVIFAVLTTIVAFWPLLLGGGTMGKVMRNLPVVVILVLLGSLVESLLILPAHLTGKKGRLQPRAKEDEPETQPLVKQRKKGLTGQVSRGLRWVIKGPYARLVRFCVRWRYATVAFSLAVLLLGVGMWTGGRIKFTFFPQVEGDVLTCSLTMPAGTPVSRTEQAIARLETAAKTALDQYDAHHRPRDVPPLFEYSVSLVGVQSGGHGPNAGSGETGGHVGQVFIQLLEGEQRRVRARKLASLWREEAGMIPDAESLTFQSELFSAGNAIEVHLSMDDEDLLLRASEELKTELKTYPGVFDISDSFLPGKQEMQLALKPVARSLGLTLEDLARQARHAFYGAEALRFQRDQDEIKVLVRYPSQQRKSLGHVEQMRIRTQEGSEIPFGEVARVNMEPGYTSIQRAQRRRVIKVTADVDESVGNANEVRMDMETRVLPRLINKYPGLRYEVEGEGKEQKDALSDVIRGFGIALFAIYALLAIPFRSFTQPFIVMGAIPFGLVGALVGHLLMGLNLSLLSLFGMVGLAGVVVNDSLILIDAANRIRSRQGLGAQDAVMQAGGLRFRAIILTSLTTFAGLTPMILEGSLQAQFLIPMAVSLGFGVLFATGITLLLVPCGYVMLDDLHRLFESGNPNSA